MEHLQNTTFVRGFHPAQELKTRALNASCNGFCKKLTPSQLDARETFIQLYLHPSDISVQELMSQFMELLDKFFFFGLLTQGDESERLPLCVCEKPQHDVYGLSGYFNRSEYEMTLLTTIWGTNAPSTLDLLLGALSHEMTHAYLDVYFDPDLTELSEVEAYRGHGTVFTAICNAIHDTIRSWDPALAGLHVDSEPLNKILRDDSLVIVGDKFRPIQEYFEALKAPSLSQWAITLIPRIVSKVLFSYDNYATSAQALVRPN
ncbi:hypothetical protein F5X99DRAFT_370339 [Biscogniauxia marginata]|nr:hypothetical protein F5X99DRAFT_370339 [Biscogniauxia marginata]